MVAVLEEVTTPRCRECEIILGLIIDENGIAAWQCSYCDMVMSWTAYLQGRPPRDRPQEGQPTRVTTGPGEPYFGQDHD
eukprot:15740137-Heterocapsa_arctica.AAC.1